MAAVKKLGTVAAKGSRLEMLRALRRYYAESLDEKPTHRERAALGTRLEIVDVEIDKLSRTSQEKGGVADELRGRRATRAAQSRAGS